MSETGDQAFLRNDPIGRWPEMTYGGALSFLRRKYSHDLVGVDVAVSGVPFDNAVTYRRMSPWAKSNQSSFGTIG